MLLALLTDMWLTEWGGIHPGYNGKDVFLTPRAHLALITRTNTVDMTRRSPT